MNLGLFETYKIRLTPEVWPAFGFSPWGEQSNLKITRIIYCTILFQNSWEEK